MIKILMTCRAYEQPRFMRFECLRSEPHRLGRELLHSCAWRVRSTTAQKTPLAESQAGGQSMRIGLSDDTEISSFARSRAMGESGLGGIFFGMSGNTSAPSPAARLTK